MSTAAVKRFTPAQIVERASTLGVTLTVEGDSLLLVSEAGVQITPKIRSVISEYEADLIAFCYEQQVQEDMRREPPICGPCLDEGCLVEAIEDGEQEILLCERHTLRSWFL